jgi:xanthine dehydrogenase accessory factor
MDDRPQFAATELFPEAKRVIHGGYEDIGRYVEIGPADFVVIMTHGHASDYVVQKQAMLAAPAYIGVIGSKNKVKVIGERLTAEGFSPQQIASVHAPIGLPIKAETPAEIAVSIAAELIRVRAELGEGQ